MKAIVIFSFFIFASCVYVPKNISLSPIEPIEKIKTDTLICIEVGEFKDSRKDPSLLGHSYNLGIKVSDVKTTDNVASWIKTIYTAEIKNAGGKNCDPAREKAILTGTITNLVQTESWNIDTVIKVDLSLTGPQISFRGSFTGTSSELSWTADERAFTDSLHKAVNNLIKNSVSPLLSKADTTTSIQ